MAAIDKIYVNTYEQYSLFKEWCEKQPLLHDKYGKAVKLSNYVFKYDKTFNGGPIAIFPYYLDAYIIRNCPLDFIQKELMVNYGYWPQERIKEYYADVINWSGEGDYPYWAKKEDFITLEDGSMTIKGLTKSSYEQIKDGELYTSPKHEPYEIGRHFRCTKHPDAMYNRPFKCKRWSIDIQLPNEPNELMWYHQNHNSWDFTSEFVESDWSSSTAYVKTIRALKRMMIKKWNFPVGTKVSVSGRYVFDDYEFIITK